MPKGPKLVYSDTIQAYVNETRDEPETYLLRLEASIHEQYKALAPYLKGMQIKTMCDLGCGLGVMAAFLANDLRLTTVHLIDGDGDGKKDRGFKKDMKPWADVGCAKLLVDANTPPTVKVHAYKARPDISIDVDLLFSGRSWGHHYPVVEYLEFAKRCVKPGRWLVTDIRNETDGEVVLTNAGFRVIDRVPDPSPKCRRLLFEREG